MLDFVFIFVCIILKSSAETCRDLAKNDDDFTSDWKSSCLLFVKTRYQWNSALEHCQNLGGSLLKVKDIETKRHIETILNFNSHNGTWWISTRTTLEKDPDESNSHDTSNQCNCYTSDLRDKGWITDDCSTEHPSICSIRPSVYTECTWNNGKSYKYAVKFNGFCYIFVQRKLTWLKADDECKQIGGQLTDIRDKKTTDFINLYRQSHKLDDQDAWIGLAYVKSVDRYIWPEGKRFNYTNWDEGEPSKFGIYVIVSAVTGKWRNVSPSAWTTKREQFICKVGLPSSTTVTSHVPFSTSEVNLHTFTVLSSSITELSSMTTSFPSEEEMPTTNKSKFPVPMIAGIAVAVVGIAGVAIIIVIVIKNRSTFSNNDNPRNKTAMENTIYYSAPWDCIGTDESHHPDAETNHQQQEHLGDIELDEIQQNGSETSHRNEAGNLQTNVELEHHQGHSQANVKLGHRQTKVELGHRKANTELDVYNHLDAKPHGGSKMSNKQSILDLPTDTYDHMSSSYVHTAAHSKVETYNHLDTKPNGQTQININIYDHTISQSKSDQSYKPFGYTTDTIKDAMADYEEMTANSGTETYNVLNERSDDSTGMNASIYDHPVPDSRVQRNGRSFDQSAGRTCPQNDYDHMDVDPSNRLTPEDGTYDHADKDKCVDDIYVNLT